VADDTVVLPPNSTGNALDMAQMDRADATTVDRERVVLAGYAVHNSIAPDQVVSVRDNELSAADQDVRVLLGVLIREVRLLRRAFIAWADPDIVAMSDADNPWSEMENH